MGDKGFFVIFGIVFIIILLLLIFGVDIFIWSWNMVVRFWGIFGIDNKIIIGVLFIIPSIVFKIYKYF